MSIYVLLWHARTPYMTSMVMIVIGLLSMSVLGGVETNITSFGSNTEPIFFGQGITYFQSKFRHPKNILPTQKTGRISR